MPACTARCLLVVRRGRLRLRPAKMCECEPCGVAWHGTARPSCQAVRAQPTRGEYRPGGIRGMTSCSDKKILYLVRMRIRRGPARDWLNRRRRLVKTLHRWLMRTCEACPGMRRHERDPSQQHPWRILWGSDKTFSVPRGQRFGLFGVGISVEIAGHDRLRPSLGPSPKRSPRTDPSAAWESLNFWERLTAGSDLGHAGHAGLILDRVLSIRRAAWEARRWSSKGS